MRLHCRFLLLRLEEGKKLFQLFYVAALTGCLLCLLSAKPLESQAPFADHAQNSSNYKTTDRQVMGVKNEMADVYDFGDAPDPTYPTLLSTNGARHVVVPGFGLGVSVDAEPNGQPNSTAFGDDTDGNDDEDGVSFVTPLLRGSNARIDVMATAEGILNTWLDFNNDGDWDDEFEHVFIDTLIGAGLSTLSFLVPSNMSEDVVAIARFRFSSVGGLSYDGIAPDGEVEDYLVDVLIPVVLTSFTATYENDCVQIEWVTQSETDNWGFDLYRAESVNGEYIRITDDIIRGAGSSESSHHYQFCDRKVEAGKTYYYKLSDVNFNGGIGMTDPIYISLSKPEEYALEQNYPNPFNPETTIHFDLAAAGDVSLKVYNVLGQSIKTLVADSRPIGSYNVMWDGTDEFGALMSSGVYLYVLDVNGFRAVRRMTLAK